MTRRLSTKQFKIQNQFEVDSKFWLAKKTITLPYWDSISRSGLGQTLFLSELARVKKIFTTSYIFPSLPYSHRLQINRKSNFCRHLWRLCPRSCRLAHLRMASSACAHVASRISINRRHLTTSICQPSKFCGGSDYSAFSVYKYKTSAYVMNKCHRMDQTIELEV